MVSWIRTVRSRIALPQLTLKQWAGCIALTLLVVGVGVRVVGLLGERATARAERDRVVRKVEQLEADRARIEADIRYYSNPDNAEKAARAQYNYVTPGQKLLITVPQQPSQ